MSCLLSPPPLLLSSSPPLPPARLEEESANNQKLMAERAQADNKIKVFEEQITVNEDNISKVSRNVRRSGTKDCTVCL